jgi:nicotinate-nucleotide adenylyltransferase
LSPERAAGTGQEAVVGILGGTFDPPHLAHLAIAEEAREVLGLDRVLFLPAGRPWQKADRAVTSARLRVAMVERAIAGNPAFVLDAREVDRDGPSYTVDTLAELAAARVAQDPWFILSSEALAGFGTWRDPERILALARLCVVPRGDAPTVAVEAFRTRFRVADERLAVLDHPRLAISSTEIRARVRAGRSIRYLVPDAVAALVAEYALYVAGPEPSAPPAAR